MPTLEATLDQAWQLLTRGVGDRRHGFHWPVVCSHHQGEAHGRIVVLRGIDRAAREVWFHTDRRSAKLDQLDGLSWVFYDPKSRVQLRLYGWSTMAEPSVADAEWDRLPSTSRRTYRVEPAPGTPLEAYSSGLPPDAEGRSGRASFAVVVTEVERVESLKLGREGHERARFTWAEDRFVGTWLVP
ncbi:MAG: pyridoxamine 5'-phosphate oxidase [Myxococcota bacterium]